MVNDAARGPVQPPLYEVSHGGRRCTRWLGEHDCGKPSVRHVIWDETMENGFVCAEHLSEVGPVWKFFSMHEVGPDCAMPGSFFVEEENTCRCADELVAAPEIEVEGAIVVHA